MPQPLTEAKAKSAYLMNALVLPGTGTLMAGETARGLCQILLALVGSIMSLLYVVLIGVAYLQNPGHFPSLSHPMWLGFPLFLISWTWSLFSSHRLLLQARRVTLPASPASLHGV